MQDHLWAELCKSKQNFVRYSKGNLLVSTFKHNFLKACGRVELPTGILNLWSYFNVKLVVAFDICSTLISKA